MLEDLVLACVIIAAVLAACWMLDRRGRAAAAQAEAAADQMEKAAERQEAAADAMQAHANARQAAADRAERDWRERG